MTQVTLLFGKRLRGAIFRATRPGESLELWISLYSEYTEKFDERKLLVVCGAYLHAECGDLQYALDSKHPREAHVHVLQRILVRLGLPMILQCIHWQIHGRQTNICMYKLIKLHDSCERNFLFYFIYLFFPFFSSARPSSLPFPSDEKGRSGSVFLSFFSFTPKLCAPIHEHSVLHNRYRNNGVKLASARLTCWKTKQSVQCALESACAFRCNWQI